MNRSNGPPATDPRQLLPPPRPLPPRRIGGTAARAQAPPAWARAAPPLQPRRGAARHGPPGPPHSRPALPAGGSGCRHASPRPRRGPALRPRHSDGGLLGQGPPAAKAGCEVPAGGFASRQGALGPSPRSAARSQPRQRSRAGTCGAAPGRS